MFMKLILMKLYSTISLLSFLASFPLGCDSSVNKLILDSANHLIFLISEITLLINSNTDISVAYRFIYFKKLKHSNIRQHSVNPRFVLYLSAKFCTLAQLPNLKIIQ